MHRKSLHANRPLKRLSIEVNTKIALSRIIEMISGNSSISTLSVVRRLDDGDQMEVITKDADELKQLVDKHPSITSLTMLEYLFKADDVIAFIRHNNSLHTFKFSVKSYSEYGRIVDQLKGERKIKMTDFNDFHSVKLNRLKN